MTAEISTSLLTALRARAAAVPDREICGLLLGRGRTVEAILPCANVAADPAVTFEIDPATLLAAHRAARAGGRAVIGHYHSHPRGPARPSPRDAAAAAGDGALWLILSPASGDAGMFAAIAGGPIEGAFAEVPLQTL